MAMAALCSSASTRFRLPTSACFGVGRAGCHECRSRVEFAPSLFTESAGVVGVFAGARRKGSFRRWEWRWNAVAEQIEADAHGVAEEALSADSVAIYFEAEGSLSEASIGKLTSALEDIEGVCNVKITATSDSSATVKHQRCHISENSSPPHAANEQKGLMSSCTKIHCGRPLSPRRILNTEDVSKLTTDRRVFTFMYLFGFLAIPFVGDCRAEAVEEILTKAPVKKGRVPSSPYDDDRLLEQNRRMQRMNNAPPEFPGFVREGFQVKVVVSSQYVTTKTGLIYYDMVVGDGNLPTDGQQVIFHYTGYNESGRRVDSSYQQGRPARTRLGINGMIPGFEEGIKTMRAGGRRIIIIPPELGPPVGPSTFFSAKQFEVFDIELLETKDCSRRTLLFYSDIVCD